jgi:hypothetical protein
MIAQAPPEMGLDPATAALLTQIGTQVVGNFLGTGNKGPSQAELAKLAEERARREAQQKLMLGLGLAAVGVVGAVLILRR